MTIERHSGPVAAVDIGSISVRLMISGADGSDLERRTEIVNLSTGLADTGSIGREPAESLLGTLRSFRESIDAHRVSAVRVVATETLRRASNRDEILERVEDAIGVRAEIIGGDEEGRLAFTGAVADLDADRGPFLVIDLGGASTEFSIGDQTCEAVWSADIGARVLTERYVENDPPRPEELVAILSVVEAHVDDVVRELPDLADVRTHVGLAGTVTTAAAVEIGLITYDRDAVHHFVLSRGAVEDVYRTLVTESLADRMENPGLRPERAEAIVGGITELVAIMRRLAIDELVVSERDLLDGLVAELRS